MTNAEAMKYLNRLASDEPVFVVAAHLPAAPAILRSAAIECQFAGMGIDDLIHVTKAEDDIRDWRRRNPEKVNPRL